jgi:hypothetical protein
LTLAELAQEAPSFLGYGLRMPQLLAEKVVVAYAARGPAVEAVLGGAALAKRQVEGVVFLVAWGVSLALEHHGRVAVHELVGGLGEDLAVADGALVFCEERPPGPVQDLVHGHVVGRDAGVGGEVGIWVWEGRVTRCESCECRGLWVLC